MGERYRSKEARRLNAPCDTIIEAPEMKYYVPEHQQAYQRNLRVDQLTSEFSSFNFRAIWQHVDAHGNIALLCVA